MAVEVALDTPLAEALNAAIQPKLVEVGWSTGGADDSALSEYIILMLVNGKTQGQIAAELSGDLLQLGPDDPGAIEFSRWLFEQVGLLHTQISGDPSATAAPATAPPANGHEVATAPHAISGSSVTGDTEMGEGSDDLPEASMHVPFSRPVPGYGRLMIDPRPTGPRSMRGNRNKRLFGQLSKAMDRAPDAVLHRVRPQQGTERINTHAREPPKGPRNLQGRIGRPLNGRAMGPMPHGVGGMPAMGLNPGLAQMTPQQQMQLFAMYEEQARMMSQILSPQQQQQQVFTGAGMPSPMMNGNFGAIPQPPTAPGRSLFDRVEKHPRKPPADGNRHPHALGGKSSHGDTTAMDRGTPQDDAGTTAPDPAETVCKFNLTCTKSDCPYAHQTSAAPPGASIDVHDNCAFGAACKNRKCVARHPSPATKVLHQAEQDCRFFPNCTNSACPFRHPAAPLCRNGADCTRPGCTFTHVKTTCKYNPCLNPACPFKHELDQKRGAFHDKVWSAGEKQERGHVSERKFIDEKSTGEEELIRPGGQAPDTSLGNELVT
ncbi:MAG: hypothetical protein M1838_003687 [Thelocarpon superellum]|nr:MAG: hypothetical protein M1838_003687 [Thelocarpon superellum]